MTAASRCVVDSRLIVVRTAFSTRENKRRFQHRFSVSCARIFCTTVQKLQVRILSFHWRPLPGSHHTSVQADRTRSGFIPMFYKFYLNAFIFFVHFCELHFFPFPIGFPHLTLLKQRTATFNLRAPTSRSIYTFTVATPISLA